HRTAGREQLRADQLVLRGHRPDEQGSRLIVDTAQLAQILQVHQLPGFGQPQLHHWDQTVAPGDDTCVLAKLRQQPEGFLQRLRPMICERRGYQFALPQSSLSGAPEQAVDLLRINLGFLPRSTQRESCPARWLAVLSGPSSPAKEYPALK